MAKQQQNSEEIYISDLEQQLVLDEDGNFRDYLMSQLYDQLLELKKLLNQGTTPDEHNKLELLILAVSAAGETVAKTWQKHHKQLVSANK